MLTGYASKCQHNKILAKINISLNFTVEFFLFADCTHEAELSSERNSIASAGPANILAAHAKMFFQVILF